MKYEVEDILIIECEAPEAAACLAQLGMSLVLVSPHLIRQMELSNPQVQVLPGLQMQALPQGQPQVRYQVPQQRRDMV